jgi:TolA-binding protein
MSEKNPTEPETNKEGEEKVTAEKLGSRRNFIKYGAAFAVGVAATSAVELPVLESQISQQNTTIQQKDTQIQQQTTQITQQTQQIGQLTSQVNTDNQTIAGLQGELAREQGFLTLNPQERILVESVAETMIPSDENGPGAKEAGVIYFIDRQLAGSYGKNGNMYMEGPFVKPGLAGPLTVGSITYKNGTPSVRVNAGTRYQYALSLREYWRRGLQFLEDYSTSAYGGNFESLSLDKQTQVLQDLFNDKPTNFTGPTALEFVSEMHDMIMGGFFTDPLYGGNKEMVSWVLAGFNGTNMGETVGKTPIQLAVMSQPLRLTPKSLSDLQNEG